MVAEVCEVSVVMPVYDDRRVLTSIDRVIKILKEKNIKHELIVSGVFKDPEKLKHVIFVEANRKGKGYAVKRGVFHSRGRKIIVCDADFPVEESIFIGMLQEMEGKDVLFGKRVSFINDASGSYPLKRRIISKVFRTVVGFIFSTQGIDTQCGLKCFKANVAHSIYSNTRTNGLLTDIEVTVLCRQQGITIHHLPLTWKHVPESTISLVKDSPSVLYEMIKLVWIYCVGNIKT